MKTCHEPATLGFQQFCQKDQNSDISSPKLTLWRAESLAGNTAKLGLLEGNLPWNGGFLADLLLVSGSFPGFLVKKDNNSGVLENNANLKYDNLQYNTLGRWADHLINQVSDGPSIILIDWK